MNSTNPADQIKPVLRLALWVFVASLAFLHVFITFRGLASPAAMDQAQIARELARGHGFSTQMVRPSSLRMMQDHQREALVASLPDTSHPPLQPVLWAPVFKALESWWPFETTGMIYRMDRVIACMSTCWFLLTLVLMHGIARRLFDRTLAGFAVLAVVLSRPMWMMVTSGGHQALLLFCATAAAWCLMILMQRADSGEPAGLMPFLLALLCTAMVMTQWMAAWLVLGVGISVALLLPRNRGTLVMVILLPMIATAAWLARNQMICGEVLGTAKASLQSILVPFPDSVQMRDYESATPPLVLAALLRRVNAHFSGQIEDLFSHVLLVVPAVLFFIALLHRFRRADVNRFRWAVAIMWGCSILGMSLLGLPDGPQDDRQLHAIMVPSLTVLGLAGLAVLWARFNPGHGGVWTRHGFAILAIGIGGWPMIMGLTSDLRLGLFMKNQLMQADYRAASLARLTEMVEDDETLVSDAPWAVAWYADRPTIWLPKTREQFDVLRDLAKKQKHPVAGVVITSLCMKGETLATQFTGPYAEWVDLIARGPVRGLGVDLAQTVERLRDYPHMLPLGWALMPDGRPVFPSNFFSDRDRWTALKEAQKP